MNTINHKIKKTALAQVIAVVAAIFVAYISFMGLVYMSHGRIVMSAMMATLIGIAMVSLCFMAQQMKGAESKFARSIVKERIAIVSLAIVLLAPVIPFLHFFSVVGRGNAVERQYEEALSEVMPMFDEYDSLVDKRVAKYKKRLASVKNKQSKNYTKYGFNKHTEGLPDKGLTVMRENMVGTLQTLLAPPTLDSLRQDARQWVETARKGSSVWNVFLLGNSNLTTMAIKSWEKTMDKSMSLRLGNEGDGNSAFKSKHADLAVERLGQLSSECARFGMPPLYAIPLLLIALLLMFFPYVLQTRHSKSWERLRGKKKTPCPDWNVVAPRQARQSSKTGNIER